MYKNVFINGDNELNENGMGRMVNIQDLNEDLCIGNKNIEGLIQTTEGAVIYVDNSNNQESVNEVGEIMEYIKVSEEKNKLYASLIEDTEERGLEIIKCNLAEYCLTAIVQDHKKEWIYVFNIWYNKGEEIIKNQTMIWKDMLMNSLKVLV